MGKILLWVSRALIALYLFTGLALTTSFIFWNKGFFFWGEPHPEGGVIALTLGLVWWWKFHRPMKNDNTIG